MLSDQLLFIEWSVQKQDNVVVILNTDEVFRGQAKSLQDHILSVQSHEDETVYEIKVDEIRDFFSIKKPHDRRSGGRRKQGESAGFDFTRELSFASKRVIDKLPDTISKAEAEFPDDKMAIAIASVGASLTAFANVLVQYDEHIKAYMKAEIKKTE